MITVSIHRQSSSFTIVSPSSSSALDVSNLSASVSHKVLHHRPSVIVVNESHSKSSSSASHHRRSSSSGRHHLPHYGQSSMSVSHHRQLVTWLVIIASHRQLPWSVVIVSHSQVVSRHRQPFTRSGIIVSHIVSHHVGQSSSSVIIASHQYQTSSSVINVSCHRSSSMPVITVIRTHVRGGKNTAGRCACSHRRSYSRSSHRRCRLHRRKEGARRERERTGEGGLRGHALAIDARLLH